MILSQVNIRRCRCLHLSSVMTPGSLSFSSPTNQTESPDLFIHFTGLDEDLAVPRAVGVWVRVLLRRRVGLSGQSLWVADAGLTYVTRTEGVIGLQCSGSGSGGTPSGAESVTCSESSLTKSYVIRIATFI
jgi:hypothetical protein